jgi:nucleotide-binding universal stress UspA family protein
MAPGTGALPPCLAGSGSTTLAAVADRTTVREGADVTRIVVGIDASEDSLRALRWALREAELRQASVELVHAYPIPELTAMPMIVTLPSDDELQKAAEQVLTDALATVGGAADIPVTTTARAGSPAAVLCDVARDAELLVVGARGLGGFRGLLLGSVSHQVVAHSPCPVVTVVPEER